MPTQGEIVASMMAALRLSEPNLDTSIGTPARKILDAVGESVAEAYADQHLIHYQYDIDSKWAGDLDAFVALFGFQRIPPQRATGTVTFIRPNDEYAQKTALVLPAGTQAVALLSPPVYVETVSQAVMNPNHLSVEVPVQAVVAGPLGNVAAGLINTLVTGTAGLSKVINNAPLTGGTPMETDEQLRARFKSTVFRSLAGTEAMYEGTMREIPQDPTGHQQGYAVSSVNVLGSSKRWREQIQLVNGTADVTLEGAGLTGAGYIYPDNVYVGADIDAGTMLVRGADYTFTPSNPTNAVDHATATLGSLNSTSMPDGLYDIDFEYVPMASRNDPANARFNQGAVNNRIDIYVNGVIPQAASQTIVFSNAKRFSSSPSATYYNGKYAQLSSTIFTPVNNYVFVPLAFGPILTVPDSMIIGGTTYVEGVDYWIVHQDDAFGYTSSSNYGLAWKDTRLPANGTTFTINYTYNRICRDGQDMLSQWRLVGTDAKVHAGKRVALKFNLAMVYDRKYDKDSVKTAVDATLAQYLTGLGFQAAVQVSDILNQIHNVPGVDNVRFLTSTDDSTSYAMSRMSEAEANAQMWVYHVNGRARDVQFAPNEYPVFHSTNIVQKAPNTFGSGV